MESYEKQGASLCRSITNSTNNDLEAAKYNLNKTLAPG